MKKIVLILVLFCLPVMADEWEYKIVEEVTDLTTWVNESLIYHNLDGSTIAKLPEETILQEICKIYAKNKGFKGWKVIKTDIRYTKATSKNKEGLAGKFWLVIKFWMVREKIKPKPIAYQKIFEKKDRYGRCYLSGVSEYCICEDKQ